MPRARAGGARTVKHHSAGDGPGGLQRFVMIASGGSAELSSISSCETWALSDWRTCGTGVRMLRSHVEEDSDDPNAEARLRRVWASPEMVMDLLAIHSTSIRLLEGRGGSAGASTSGASASSRADRPAGGRGVALLAEAWCGSATDISFMLNDLFTNAGRPRGGGGARSATGNDSRLGNATLAARPLPDISRYVALAVVRSQTLEACARALAHGNFPLGPEELLEFCRATAVLTASLHRRAQYSAQAVSKEDDENGDGDGSSDDGKCSNDAEDGDAGSDDDGGGRSILALELVAAVRRSNVLEHLARTFVQGANRQAQPAAAAAAAGNFTTTSGTSAAIYHTAPNAPALRSTLNEAQQALLVAVEGHLGSLAYCVASEMAVEDEACALGPSVQFLLAAHVAAQVVAAEDTGAPAVAAAVAGGVSGGGNKVARDGKGGGSAARGGSAAGAAGADAAAAPEGWMMAAKAPARRMYGLAAEVLPPPVVDGCGGCQLASCRAAVAVLRVDSAGAVMRYWVRSLKPRIQAGQLLSAAAKYEWSLRLANAAVARWVQARARQEAAKAAEAAAAAEGPAMATVASAPAQPGQRLTQKQLRQAAAAAAKAGKASASAAAGKQREKQRKEEEGAADEEERASRLGRLPPESCPDVACDSLVCAARAHDARAAAVAATHTTAVYRAATLATRALRLAQSVADRAGGGSRGGDGAGSGAGGSGDASNSGAGGGGPCGSGTGGSGGGSRSGSGSGSGGSSDVRACGLRAGLRDGDLPQPAQTATDVQQDAGAAIAASIATTMTVSARVVPEVHPGLAWRLGAATGRPADWWRSAFHVMRLATEEGRSTERQVSPESLAELLRMALVEHVDDEGDGADDDDGEGSDGSSGSYYTASDDPIEATANDGRSNHGSGHSGHGTNTTHCSLPLPSSIAAARRAAHLASISRGLYMGLLPAVERLLRLGVPRMLGSAVAARTLQAVCHWNSLRLALLTGPRQQVAALIVTVAKLVPLLSSREAAPPGSDPRVRQAVVRALTELCPPVLMLLELRALQEWEEVEEEEEEEENGATANRGGGGDGTSVTSGVSGGSASVGSASDLAEGFGAVRMAVAEKLSLLLTRWLPAAARSGIRCLALHVAEGGGAAASVCLNYLILCVLEWAPVLVRALVAAEARGDPVAAADWRHLLLEEAEVFVVLDMALSWRSVRGALPAVAVEAAVEALSAKFPRNSAAVMAPLAAELGVVGEGGGRGRGRPQPAQSLRAAGYVELYRRVEKMWGEGKAAAAARAAAMEKLQHDPSGPSSAAVAALLPPHELASSLGLCANPHCANLAGDSESGVGLPAVCGGCGAAAYCGWACLAAAARAGHSSPLCAALKARRAQEV